MREGLSGLTGLLSTDEEEMPLAFIAQTSNETGQPGVRFVPAIRHEVWTDVEHLSPQIQNAWDTA